MIIVQPAANAVATLRVIIMNAKFHGVVAAVGPTGSLNTSTAASGTWDGMVSP